MIIIQSAISTVKLPQITKPQKENSSGRKVGLHVSGAKRTCSPLQPVMNS
jgi:hypothetical protein